MYNCYNDAYAYLKGKYGYTRRGFTDKFRKSISNLKKQEKKEAIANATDKDYEIRLDLEDISPDDMNIVRLMDQYYYGIPAKKELYYKLLEIGVLTE